MKSLSAGHKKTAGIAAVAQMDRTIQSDQNATDAIYQQLKIPFDYFNASLFKGEELPDCVLTLTHKSTRALGYFRPSGFKNKNGLITDEIAMNPRIFLCNDLSYILSIIVHEMAHMWKHHKFGSGQSGGYHCRKWGAKMDELGLPPSNTGKPGGKRTGYQMMHYIEKDGAFDRACQDLLSQGFEMNWGFTQQLFIKKEGGSASKSKNKIKYTCSACGLNCWAKPNVQLGCIKCAVVMRGTQP